MRKTKNLSPIISGVLIIFLLSFRSNDKLLIEHLLGNGIMVIGVIVVLYSVAVFMIIQGILSFRSVFETFFNKIVAVLHSGFRRINDV